MKKALWLLFFLGIFVSLSLGQDFKLKSLDVINTESVDKVELLRKVKTITSNAALLWDNISGLTNQYGLPSTRVVGVEEQPHADDFIVPEHYVWEINSVVVGGRVNVENTFIVQIYENDGGLPGDLLFEVGATRVQSELGVYNFYDYDLDSPILLGPGTYWFGFMQIGQFTEFYWLDGIQGKGMDAVISYDDFATPEWDFPWANFMDGYGIEDLSLTFSLNGTAQVEGPGFSTNPFPANNAIDIPQAGTTLTWTNPGGAKALDYNEVYFGSDQALVEARDESVKVLGDGSSIYTEYETGELEYNTTYYWAVDNTELAKIPGTTPGTLWKFTVEPAYPEFTWIDDFEAGSDNWDIYGVDGSVCLWEADESPWDNAYTMPPSASGTIMRADADLCGSGTSMNTFLEMNKGVDLSNFGNTVLLFDADQNDLTSVFEIDVSIDGGLTWMNIFSEAGIDRRAAEMEIPVPEADFQADVRFRFHYIAQWDWWWAIDNVTIHAVTPLTSMYGYLMHPNENPISGATLRMESEEKYIFETTTDEDGWFEFMEVPPGTFWMDIVSDYPAYTLDTRDAFLVSKQANKTEPYPTGDMFFVSDVTADGEVRWNDAVMIFERIFGDIDGFNQPDWLGTFGDEAFVHGGEDMDMGILYAWLAGDADFSYGNTLRSLKMLEVTKSGSRSLAIGSEVSVPYYVTSDAEVSAAMMRFNYSDKYEFVGLDSKLANATVINGEGFVGIMYIDKPVNFNSGDELLTLNFRLKDGQEVPEDFEITVDEKSAMLEKSGNFVTTGLQTLSFGEVIPTKYELTQNYPNPFNPTTKISFSLPQADVVTLKVYDILGSEVATLVNEKLEAGVYEFNFNASNLPSGAYIYRIQTDNFQSTKKMMLLK
ncbi:MAG: T9SS type A sorting domain-containing protein [Melioribacteraceae bacterium]|nr:T9SS type A sorting domain-containing protein [Melioribacteraceae bacterium]